MRYVDGYVLPAPRQSMTIYRRMARRGGRIWREHGALEFRECVGDDLDVKWGATFPRRIKLKPGETVVFSCAWSRPRTRRQCRSTSSARSTADSRSWSISRAVLPAS